MTSPALYLGLEIGGTKLQLGVGAGDGKLLDMWRHSVDVKSGAAGIRSRILQAVPELLQRSRLDRERIRGMGIGFGGPVNDATRTVIKSHQIDGWDNFPLADWIGDNFGWPALLGNDADLAGLAEAAFGAGQRVSPIFYITIGSGIGGGFLIDGEIYRGCGQGAAEIGHLKVLAPDDSENGTLHLTALERVASGWGIEDRFRRLAGRKPRDFPTLLELAAGQSEKITTAMVGQAIRQGDKTSQAIFEDSLECLAQAICHVITLLSPRRIVIGGGVSLLGEQVLFTPLRRLVADRVFEPLAGCYDIVPAALGEEVVVHGALALARRKLA
jgi:glucokinase